MTNYNPLEVEKEILEYWQDNKIYEKLKDMRKDGEKFYFLQGPPYTSGRLHVGHAWNNTLKDLALRYKRMCGFDVWDRAGYDTHGLPTEHKVMQKNNLHNKEEIENFGVEKFIKECLEWSTDKAAIMSEDLWRMAVWMDYENAYMPIENSYIEGEWWLVKKAHEKNRLYKGKRVMHWCPSCETALAKHELIYENVTDNSIFLKFPVKDKENEFLVIWTTTPWTIPFNMGVMVNPEIDYVKAKVDNEIWIVAKQLAAPLIQMVVGKKLDVVEEFKGETLEGLKYVHPLYNELKPVYDELIKNSEKIFTVVMSKEYVTTDAGSGLVHMAPGCGPEDYEVGHQNKIPIFNNIDELGRFPEEMGIFAGKVARKDDKFFIEQFEKNNSLIASTPVEHDYAHCDRCKTGVVFKTTDQWFFKVEDLKERMIEENKDVHWVPKKGGNAFESWLKNLRDNSITRQRYWGAPVPIWECECGHFETVGSKEELKEKSIDNKIPVNFHKPWIDEVKIKCDKCQKEMSRCPDVLDVWIDAGTASWNSLKYPGNKELLENLWPVDFILEAKEQVRGWFNLLTVASYIAFDKPCFKACYMHGMLTDVSGVKMSKSLGNVLSPYEIIDKHGVDAMRSYLIGTEAGEDINFSWDEASLKHRNLIVVWNIHKLLMSMAKETGKNPATIDCSEFKQGLEEKYIYSKLHSTLKKLTEYMNNYQLDKVPKLCENMFFDISRTYIQMVRDKFALGSNEDKELVMTTIYWTMFDTLRAFSILSPFITEKIFLNLKQEFGIAKESIHHYDWPKYYDSMIDKELEKDMVVIQSIIQSALNAREKANLGLRWPLKEMVIKTSKNVVEKYEDIIKQQVNVKEINVKDLDGVKISIKADYAKLGPEYGELTPKIIAHLTTTSGESIMAQIKDKGKYSFNLNDKQIDITKSHIETERIIPDPWIGSEFRFGEVYITKERTPLLDAEGFSRELTRRVQVMRKKAELQKADPIDLEIKIPEDMKELLLKFESYIKEKCGATQINIDVEISVKEFDSEEKIKGKSFKIAFNKL